MFLEAKNALIFKKGNETLMIEPWGENSLRVRSTLDPNFIDRDWALTEKINHGNAKISVTEQGASIINGKIEAISNYNGDVTILPDIHLINKAVGIINKNEEWLKSYTIDVMVGPKGTALIEVHNFASVGLYNTLWGDNLLYAYRQGIDYLVRDNRIRI